MSSPTVIDAHAHYVPPSLFETIATSPTSGAGVIDDGEGSYRVQFEGNAPTRPLPLLLLDLERRLEWMDRQGVDVQVVGTWADIFGYELDANKAVEWCRVLNGTLIAAVADHPRLAALASLPMQSPDHAATMMQTIRQDGFVGVTIATRIGTTELDDPTLSPFWEAASQMGMTVFIHPGFDSGDPRTADYGMVNAVGRALDTTLTASRMLLAGLPSRYPGVQIMLAHGGGALPMILGRLGRNHALQPELSDPAANLGSIFFDTVVFDAEALWFLVRKVGTDSVMLGSDYPFPIGDPQPLAVVRETPDLTEQERASILGDNARRVFGLKVVGPMTAAPGHGVSTPGSGAGAPE